MVFIADYQYFCLTEETVIFQQFYFQNALVKVPRVLKCYYDVCGRLRIFQHYPQEKHSRTWPIINISFENSHGYSLFAINSQVLQGKLSSVHRLGQLDALIPQYTDICSPEYCLLVMMMMIQMVIRMSNEFMMKMNPMIITITMKVRVLMMLMIMITMIIVTSIILMMK